MFGFDFLSFFFFFPFCGFWILTPGCHSGFIFKLHRPTAKFTRDLNTACRAEMRSGALASEMVIMECFTLKAGQNKCKDPPFWANSDFCWDCSLYFYKSSQLYRMWYAIKNVLLRTDMSCKLILKCEGWSDLYFKTLNRKKITPPPPPRYWTLNIKLWRCGAVCGCRQRHFMTPAEGNERLVWHDRTCLFLGRMAATQWNESGDLICTSMLLMCLTSPVLSGKM